MPEKRGTPMPSLAGAVFMGGRDKSGHDEKYLNTMD
jgi:hypothetical protein